MIRKINHEAGAHQSFQSFPKAKSLQENGHTYQYIQIDSKHEDYYKGPIKGLLMCAFLIASVIILPLAIFGALFSQDYRNTWSRAFTGKEVVLLQFNNARTVLAEDAVIGPLDGPALDKSQKRDSFTDAQLAEQVEITSIKADNKGKGILKESSAQKTPSARKVQFSVPEATFTYEQLAQEIDAIYSSEALFKMQQADRLLKKHEVNPRDILKNAEAKEIFTGKKGAQRYLQAKEKAFHALKLTKTDRQHLPYDNKDKTGMNSQAALLFIQEAIRKTLEKMPRHATAEALHQDLQEQFDTRLDKQTVFPYFSFLNILENEATKALFMKELRLVDVLIHAFPEKKEELLNEYHLLMAPHTEALAQEGAAGEPSLTQIFSVAHKLFGSEESIAAVHDSPSEIKALVTDQLAAKNITLQQILDDEKSRELFAKSPILVQVLVSEFPEEKNALVAQYILLNRETIAPVTTEAAKIDDIWEGNVLGVLQEFSIEPKIFFADSQVVKYFILSRKLKYIAGVIKENEKHS